MFAKWNGMLKSEFPVNSPDQVTLDCYNAGPKNVYKDKSGEFVLDAVGFDSQNRIVFKKRYCIS